MQLFCPPDVLRARLYARSHDDANGCRVWDGCLNSKGYGCIGIGRKSKNALAHRVAYFLAHGTIDDALTIDHLCRNHACINVAHLELVTQRVNNHRGLGFSGRNIRKTHCPQGHAYKGKNLKRKHRKNGVVNRICVACERAAYPDRYLREREYQLAYRRAERMNLPVEQRAVFAQAEAAEARASRAAKRPKVARPLAGAAS